MASRVLFVVYDNGSYDNEFPMGVGALTAILKQQGHEWEYTGKQFWNNEGPAILIESHKETKPRYYWRIGDLEHRRVKWV